MASGDGGIRIQGDFLALERRLNRLVRIDFRKVHQEIGEYVLGTIHDRFKNGVGPDGHPWKKSVRAEVESGQTLVNTRHFEESFTYRVTVNRVDVGTNWPFAAVHQEGRIIRAKNAKALRFKIGGRWVIKKQVKIPARPVVGLNANDQTEIRDIVAEAIGRVIE